MSINNYILNLLSIKDNNIHIIEKIKKKVIKGKNYKIIEGILTYNPKYCPCCGVVNQSNQDIIKWGFRKNCKIKIPKISNCYSMLILHKQRFYCKNCNNTFIAETNLVNRNKNISNNTELQINLELMKKQSEKDTAERLDVSISKIDRKLRERDKVKHISTDFYSGYIFLAKKLFKYANISIDRFHIVTQVYVALNSTRVSLCYKSNPNYNKLKDLWKLILKNENELSEEKKYKCHFQKEVSQKKMVTYMINTDKTLKATYECYQGIINSIKNKDFNKFKTII